MCDSSLFDVQTAESSFTVNFLIRVNCATRHPSVSFANKLWWGFCLFSVQNSMRASSELTHSAARRAPRGCAGLEMLGARKWKKPGFRLRSFPCKSRLGQPFVAYRCISS
ncbi:hypothetical protein TGPRC2_270925 [Toxoplasma gondii TgCatPRC2]|uniref:Uncharacterized protein n=3 Tax=Toxoplasma gondii TaxID=5811 RepID=A0A151HNV9_TOXGO|nr:hypothetical protein TGME49_270925 [Toxoplasma gondii ME49]EPT28462.1 hypothetical protein TGME49_270925 [Toxoplasma gondii ME49]KYF46843.1 hypothetical protein TGARI_270925 [Toxoplasma gondii ARI]KYK71089.1 hypothetical protein TGPRC2_270925 [Toxoplasma gondii TgCatPRC2]|eukprot:XP_018636628.1 hypothetical protein TGME49_270925 [Toxoplasma gondii ME49]